MSSNEIQTPAQRRDRFFAAMRKAMPTIVDPTGRGKIPQFQPPYREPVWCLPALYRGTQADIDLANRMVAGYHQQPAVECRDIGVRSGKMFNIFQTNTFTQLFHDYRHLLTPAADEVMRWHAQQSMQTFAGSAQPDFVFRGGNDNMPALATGGLLAAGQALDNAEAISHAHWNLRQLRALLARNAWMSEFNSSTYSAVTLSTIAKIATIARAEEIRTLALQIEHRLWAEILLHYHPGTFHQAGPMSRAYGIDYAGHNHALQLMLWYAFGEGVMGRDLIQAYFQPDGREVIHFQGCYLQTAAEFCHFLDTDLHIPAELTGLAVGRRYPAILRGRAEVRGAYEMSGPVQTETYMEEAFSLGTSNRPFCGGEQTASLYLTYRLKAKLQSWRDAATVFYGYRTDDTPMGTLETSEDGGFQGEKFQANQAWCYTLQKNNVAALFCTPNLKKAPFQTNILKLNLFFPVHFGSITASIMGDGPCRAGAVGESTEVVPVSVQAGEVFIHIQPLLPTLLPRKAALRFSRQNQYEVLELINYEGDCRTFTRQQLGLVLNGMVITVAAAGKHASLEAFHRQQTPTRLVDYFFTTVRLCEFVRADVWFRLAMSTNSPGVMTELIDGLPRSAPIFESNQIDVAKLPFLHERITPDSPFFPWDQMEMMEHRNSWIIGSRGLPGERPYSQRVEHLDPRPDGPRAECFPIQARHEAERRELELELKGEKK